MKLVIIFVAVSIAVTVAMMFQALRQELNLRNLRARVAESSAEVRRKEDSIMEMKSKIQTLKSSVETSSQKLEELKKEKTDKEKALQVAEKKSEDLQYREGKGNTEKKKTELEESIKKLNTDHEAAKSKAQLEIEGLKNQILDRDKTICAYADMTKEEARKLCGESGAAQ